MDSHFHEHRCGCYRMDGDTLVHKHSRITSRREDIIYE